MSGQKIDQKEYLKKYLSGGSSSHTKKKKKKKEKSASNVRVNIVDDDIDLSQLANATEEDLDNYNLGEDLPQIAGIVDERPADLIAKEDYKTSAKWKTLENDDNETAKLAKNPETQRSDDSSFDMKNKRVRNRTPTKSNRSPDASPPRKSNRGRDSSPPRRRSPQKRSDHSPDASPPRRSNRSRDSSPLRKKSPPKRKDRSPDASPPRKSDRNRDSSPRRRRSSKTRWNRSSDASPPRKSDRNRDSSPRRKRSPQKHSNYNPDASPPRRSNRSPDLSPRRKRSPPKRSDRSPDASPLRKSNRSRDSSPPRRRMSPKRSGRSPDASPPRRLNRSPDSKHSDRKPNIKRKISDSPPPTHKKMSKTLEGKIAGLQDAKALREENEQFKRREDEMYRKMEEKRKNDDDGTVIGDRRTGRRRHLREDVEKDREKQKKYEERKQVYDRWGKGLKQLEEYKARVETESHEMSKPVARYANDEDLEDHLKNQYREGDPMAAYMRKKATETQKGPSKPTYQGAFPENRFGIRPGYRWDGVDRSNGYEKKWFDNLSSKKAVEEEAYKYSVEDM